MIYESNAYTVLLSREIAYLHDYISLQRLRYKETPVVNLEIVGNVNSTFIAPLPIPGTQTPAEYILIKAGHRIQKVALNEITYIEGMKDYLQIHTAKGKIMTLMNLTTLEELLPAAQFVRVHRSFMIAIDKIDHIERKRIRIADQMIPISDSYAEAFYKMLKGS
jgi:DNA-binding LytR/AlgR family response regulator